MSIRHEDIKDTCTRAGLCARQYGATMFNSVSGSLEINLESFIFHHDENYIVHRCDENRRYKKIRYLAQIINKLIHKRHVTYLFCASVSKFLSDKASERGVMLDQFLSTSSVR